MSNMKQQVIIVLAKDMTRPRIVREIESLESLQVDLTEKTDAFASQGAGVAFGTK